MASRNRSRSVRERSSSTLGACSPLIGGAAGVSGRFNATYSPFASDDRLHTAGLQQRHELRAIGGRQRRRPDVPVDGERDVALGRPLELRGEGVVEAEADGERSP